MNAPYGSPPPPAGMSKVAVALLFLFIGLGVGFCGGIGATKAGASFLEDFASDEAAADVAHPKSHVRPGFSFKYAGNWKIDMDDASKDPDHQVTVESPGSCMTMLVLLDAAIAPSTSVETQVNAFVPKLLAAPSRTPFTTWGKYTGEGMLLKGRLLGLNEGSVRVFAYANEKRSFVAVEQCYDEDMAHVKPGFDLLESSFELLP
jgi:hypothetical protein